MARVTLTSARDFEPFPLVYGDCLTLGCRGYVQFSIEHLAYEFLHTRRENPRAWWSRRGPAGLLIEKPTAADAFRAYQEYVRIVHERESRAPAADGGRQWSEYSAVFQRARSYRRAA